MKTPLVANGLAMPLADIQAYLLMARALISQGAVDVEKPSDEMARWARWAVRSTDGVLTDAVAKLAEGTAVARAERYIELQLIAPGTTANDPITDFEVADRLHLLLLVAADHRRFTRLGLATSLDGSAAVLFSSNEDAITSARTLSKESDFSAETLVAVAYACTFQPALPPDFLEGGADPLAPAREFLQTLTADTRAALSEHVGPQGLEVRL